MKKTYFEKHVHIPALIDSSPLTKVDVTVVIPCYNEENILEIIGSLENCDNPECTVEIIIVINHNKYSHENAVLQNRQSLEELLTIKSDAFIIYPLFLEDVSGVGEARKIGMDEAARRMGEDGIIVGLDADCKVSKNYLRGIRRHFTENPLISGCSLYFEHPIEGFRYDNNIYHSIILYELHLRYYIDMQRRINLPYAYQTVGSSMAVRNKYYQLLGGMNKRQAGEDFYFIQKFIKNGRFSELNEVVVFPSPRISDRVPFGTGRAVGQMMNADDKPKFLTYNPNSFEEIRTFIMDVEKWYRSEDVNFSSSVLSFFKGNTLNEKLLELKENTSNFSMFTQRFYLWFDAFNLMKYLHYLRDNYFCNIDIVEACRKTNPLISETSAYEMLLHYRDKAKKVIGIQN